MALVRDALWCPNQCVTPWLFTHLRHMGSVMQLSSCPTMLFTKGFRNICAVRFALTTVEYARLTNEIRDPVHGCSHCGFDEPCGAKTVRYDSFVRDMTTWSVTPW